VRTSKTAVLLLFHLLLPCHGGRPVLLRRAQIQVDGKLRHLGYVNDEGTARQFNRAAEGRRAIGIGPVLPLQAPRRDDMSVAPLPQPSPVQHHSLANAAAPEPATTPTERSPALVTESHRGRRRGSDSEELTWELYCGSDGGCDFNVCCAQLRKDYREHDRVSVLCHGLSYAAACFIFLPMAGFFIWFAVEGL
jgi:hypothetical protein